MSPREPQWAPGDKFLTQHKRAAYYAPSGKGKNGHLWRLDYWVDGKRSQPTARSWAEADRKAREAEARIIGGTTKQSERPVADLVEYWLSPERPKPRDDDWGDSHLEQMQRYARDFILPTLGRKRCSELTVQDIQRCIDATSSKDQGDRVRRAFSTLIRAGHQGHFLLSSQQFDLRDVRRHGTAVRRVRTQGEDVEFVAADDRPSHAQVRALAEAAASRETRKTPAVWWRGLAVYLAAYSGVRLGELRALTYEDFEGRQIRVRAQVVEPRGGGKHLGPPKMSKQRHTLYRRYPVRMPDPENPGRLVPDTSFDLQALVERRCAEARAEREAGRNPKGLLFPTQQGEWWSETNWHRDIFDPAAEAAGWPKLAGWKPDGSGCQRKWRLTWHDLRHVFCTVALGEWGFSLVDVSTLAGHESVQTTARRYIGSMQGAMDRMIAATEE